jgi:hypothetical protein
MTHAWFVQMGGFAIQNSEGTVRSLGGRSFLHLLSAGALALPNTTKIEIEEKSKGSGIAKTIACIQILYLAANLLGRAIQHLPVSTLELFTLAMVIMTLMLYALWWSKPLDVRVPIILETKASDKEVLKKMVNIGSRSDWNVPGKSLLSSDEDVGNGSRTGRFIQVVAMIAFGACHLIGWAFDFPTEVEALLWKIASVCCLVLPLAVMFVVSTLPDIYEDWCFGLLVPLYVLVRLYLIVEVFVSLRKVPAGVYQSVQWSQYLPHI